MGTKNSKLSTYIGWSSMKQTDSIIHCIKKKIIQLQNLTKIVGVSLH